MNERGIRSSRSHSVRARGPFLVLETDGLSAWAHAFARDGRHLSSERASGGLPLADAAAALDNLRARLVKAPRDLFVITDEAWGGEVELPCALLARAPADIHGALRWELEGRLAQRAGTRPLGGLLVAAGAIDEAQLERLVALQESERSPHGAAPLLGELARRVEGVPAEVVTRLAAIQEWLLGSEDELRCGWSVPPHVPRQGLARVGAVGIGARKLAAWEILSRQQRLSLRGLFARELAPLGLLPPEAAERGATLLLLDTSWASLLRLSPGGALIHEPVQPEGGTWRLAELVRLLEREPTRQVGVCALRAEACALEAELVARFAGAWASEACSGLEPCADFPALDPGVWIGPATRGALRSLARKRSGAEQPALGPGQPRDPARWRRAAGVGAALGVLILAGWSLERGLESRLWKLEGELAALAAERRAQEAERTRIGALNRTLQSLEAEIAELERSAEALGRRRDALQAAELERGRDHVRRRRLPIELLESLARHAGSKVQVLSAQSSAPDHIEIRARAADGLAAQRFVDGLATDLAPLDFSPLESSSHSGPRERGGQHRLQVSFGLRVER